MIDQPFETCIVRLLTIDGIAGTGFLVSDNYAITCAHVVAKALSIPENKHNKPEGKLYLGVPHYRLEIEAKVEIWHPVLPNLKEGYSDIAILKLLKNLPNDIQPMVIKEQNFREHMFRTYGFPDGFDRSTLAQGKIVGNPLGDRVEVECEQDKCIVAGFSGAPIWDETLQGIVGMVVEAAAYQLSKKAFFIPINTLIEIWPKLHQYCRRSQKRLPSKPQSIPPLLPYLPDRLEQERYLTKAIQKHTNKQKPLLCVVHGDHYERGDKFLERLKQKYLPKFDATFDELQSYFFNCETCSHHVDELHDVLRESLGNQLLNNPFATCDHIAKRIAQDNAPVILYTNMYTKDWCRDNGTQMIYEFIKFWAEWPLSTQNHLVMVFLFFNYKNIQKKWFFKSSPNRKIRKTFQTLQTTDFVKEFKVHGVVLPELLSIEIEHVENWINTYTHDFCDPDFLHQEVGKMFTTVEQKIAMEPLARQLKQILKKCEQDYTD